MTAANSDGICSRWSHRTPWPGKWRRYSAHAISATAPPPTPLNSATICGIAVIFTCRAAGTPMTVPSAMPPKISAASPPVFTMPWISSVVTRAMSMPTAATRLPSAAVLGPESPLSPRMNREKATM